MSIPSQPDRRKQALKTMPVTIASMVRNREITFDDNNLGTVWYEGNKYGVFNLTCRDYVQRI